MAVRRAGEDVGLEALLAKLLLVARAQVLLQFVGLRVLDALEVLVAKARIGEHRKNDVAERPPVIAMDGGRECRHLLVGLRAEDAGHRKEGLVDLVDAAILRAGVRDHRRREGGEAFLALRVVGGPGRKQQFDVQLGKGALLDQGLEVLGAGRGGLRGDGSEARELRNRLRERVLRQGRDDHAGVGEGLLRDALKIRRRQGCVDAIQPIQGAGRAIVANEAREDRRDRLSVVETARQAVAAVGLGVRQPLRGGGLGGRLLEGPDDLVADVNGVLGLLDARVHRGEARILRPAAVGEELVHLLLVFDQLLVEV